MTVVGRHGIGRVVCMSWLSFSRIQFRNQGFVASQVVGKMVSCFLGRLWLASCRLTTCLKRQILRWHRPNLT